MGLKLTIFDDDIIMVSGGTVLTVDGLSSNEVLISVATGEAIEMSSHRVGSSLKLSDAAMGVVNQIYRKPEGLCVEIEVSAPRDVRIHRFHSHDTDGKLKYLISKFDENDNVPKILESLAALQYSFEEKC
jgi:hypothetical protein